jgi:pimeloyl-ACP methyl ester carboxylesterase
MPPLPTLILCHGAWHTPEYWNPMIDILEGKGYKCVAPDIIYNGRASEKPVQSMTPVIDALQQVIAAETNLGNDVVMVNHSMGGLAGTSAVKGFTKKDPSRLGSGKSGHVLGLVQITAWLPVANEVSLADLAQDFSRRHPEPKDVQLVATDNGHGWSELKGDPAKAFYNDMSSEEGKKWVSKLIGFSSAIRSARDSVYAGWKDVPMWYLVCTNDKAIVPQLQEDLLRRCREAGANVTTRECESSHSPMLSLPEATVAFVEDAVEAFGTRERL